MRRSPHCNCTSRRLALRSPSSFTTLKHGASSPPSGQALLCIFYAGSSPSAVKRWVVLVTLRDPGIVLVRYPLLFPSLLTYTSYRRAQIHRPRKPTTKILRETSKLIHRPTGTYMRLCPAPTRRVFQLSNFTAQSRSLHSSPTRAKSHLPGLGLPTLQVQEMEPPALQHISLTKLNVPHLPHPKRSALGAVVYTFGDLRLDGRLCWRCDRSWS